LRHDLQCGPWLPFPDVSLSYTQLLESDAQLRLAHVWGSLPRCRGFLNNRRMKSRQDGPATARSRKVMISAVMLTVLFGSVSGCILFSQPMRTPIGHSSDENGRRCSTYQTRSEGVYETRCDYSGPLQGSPYGR